ncbi:hypothetical protein O7599_07460 [Streptomyces sp. WMMC500]|uniref:hypothetical protein n=1 Tax=Streptomyces sp. WMMC500 TaxID=3015154 RepID=UPI00248B27A3|nr:hypothetical protein [Streptomyces sp. WMMC500]WBB62359.1 hypothetical protein O7599_07460 [Streptomyces sp. WMMC500]
MTIGALGYRYVGPRHLLRAAVGGPGGWPVTSTAGLDTLADTCAGAEFGEPMTYVVDLNGSLLLAPRRSEHVACARGENVLAAGEITLIRSGSGWHVEEVTNQSTGYCPDPCSWPAVSAALRRLGVPQPAGFTHEFVFRRCPRCRATNVVRDEEFWCAVCDEPLPRTWNFGTGPAAGAP